MADLTIGSLATKFPTGAFTQTVDDVTISLKALLGEASVQLTSERVTELNAKLFHATYAAQLEYNADTNNTVDITSYSAPFTGSTQTIDGQLFIPVSCSMNYLAPLGIDNAVPTTI